MYAHNMIASILLQCQGITLLEICTINYVFLVMYRNRATVDYQSFPITTRTVAYVNIFCIAILLRINFNRKQTVQTLPFLLILKFAKTFSAKFN